ncbi:biotin-dependent carboxyltransferase family protein [Jongsikchunia kroppenstedtii]|uniref:5-oxoprolinase subunit C family protein n=1 Tax=Jongsikchunia kroppenstedtii TaxID=1121721 RepID=UPI0003660869|nr:biotin-dependent carboxyltransferase family protein [Jongsikchunia kroppenstedtii]
MSPAAERVLTVTATGPLTTVQDLGRPGYAHLGVPLSGAADRGSLKLANRLVGNDEAAAGLEVTAGGLRLVAPATMLLAVTGAAVDLTVNGVPAAFATAIRLRPGEELALGPSASGLRSYVAVRGGIAVPAVLGSRSTDVLSGLGPPAVASGDGLPVGPSPGSWPSATEAPMALPDNDREVTLWATAGPRMHRVAGPHLLYRGRWRVDPASNRIGVRLERADDTRAMTHPPHLDPLPSEPMPLGAVQIPPSGNPVLFLADHPTTGGYPVIAVLTADSVDRAAQLRPGDIVRIAAA